MSGDALSLRMLDVEIKRMREQRKEISKTATSFDKGLLALKTLQDEERKQKINLNGTWFKNER